MGKSATGMSYGALADTALSSGFSVVAGGLGVLILTSAGHNLTTPAVPHHLADASVSIGVGLVLIAIGVSYWRRWIPRPLLAWAPASVALLACAHAGVQVFLSGNALDVIFLYIALVTAGSTVPRLWVLLAADAGAVATFLLGVSTPSQDLQTHLTGGLIMAVPTSLVLYFYLARGRRQLGLLTEQIGHEASHDQLTGLLNRRGLLAATGALIKGRAPAPLGALLLDVDGFKAVNDELGHSGGDTVLREIAALIIGLTRSSDLLARVGGDEFLVLVPTDDPKLMHCIAARMRTELCGSAGVLALPWSVSVGIGLRSVGTEADLDRLMHDADIAMYDDKNHRRAIRKDARPRLTVPGPQDERLGP